MAAPDPNLVVTNPLPLNPFTRFPYRIYPFPAERLLKPESGGTPPADEPRDAEENPRRYEAR